jgi:hypothetical protein
MQILTLNNLRKSTRKKCRSFLPEDIRLNYVLMIVGQKFWNIIRIESN